MVICSLQLEVTKSVLKQACVFVSTYYSEGKALLDIGGRGKVGVLEKGGGRFEECMWGSSGEGVSLKTSQQQ